MTYCVSSEMLNRTHSLTFGMLTNFLIGADFHVMVSDSSRLLSQYITSHPFQLSLAIPPWVGTMSSSQTVVMPCGWGVKAGMVREWVAGKTV